MSEENTRSAIHLFIQSVKKTPGTDSMGFRALRLLWQWEENHVVSLVQCCVRIGYHPCTWKIARDTMRWQKTRSNSKSARPRCCCSAGEEKFFKLRQMSFVASVSNRLQYNSKRQSGSASGLTRSCLLKHTSRTGWQVLRVLYSGWRASAEVTAACPST
jgi:hypothetical protein